MTFGFIENLKLSLRATFSLSGMDSENVALNDNLKEQHSPYLEWILSSFGFKS